MFSFWLMRGSLALVATPVLFAFSAVAQASGSTSIVCTNAFWEYNSAGQSACLVWAQLLSLCDSNGYDLSPLQNSSYHWEPPATSDDDVNECECNVVSYNLMAACTWCQSDNNWVSEAIWSENCATYDASGLGFVATGVNIPGWAYLLDNGLAWNADTASSFAASATTAPASTSTAASTTTTTTSTTTTSQSATPTSPGAHSGAGSSRSSSNIGAIVGGAVGGVAVIIIVAFLLWFFLRRKRRATRYADAGSSAAGLSPAPQQMSFSGGPTTPTVPSEGPWTPQPYGGQPSPQVYVGGGSPPQSSSVQYRGLPEA